ALPRSSSAKAPDETCETWSGAPLVSRTPDPHPVVEDEAPRKSADRWPPAVRTEYGRSWDEDRPLAASRRSPAEAQQSPVRCRCAERAADEGGRRSSEAQSRSSHRTANGR